MLTYKELLLTGPEAVCVMDSSLSIRQHNQLASILLGYRSEALDGHHLSDILYDDILIRRLQESRNEADWFHGESKLKTSSKLPLTVRFRAGSAVINPSEKEYILIFREPDEFLYINQERRLKALQFLWEVVANHDITLEDGLLKFTGIFDQHAEVILLSQDMLKKTKDGIVDHLPIPKSLTEIILKAMAEKSVMLHFDEILWGFLPIYSPAGLHGLACIKFSIPRLYDEADKGIFGLAGIIFGTYANSNGSSILGSTFQSILQIIFNSIDYPVIVVDKKGVITLCNSSSETVYGYPASKMMGKSYGELFFTVGSQAEYEELMARVIQGNIIRGLDITQFRSDLANLDMKLNAYPYLYDNGDVAGVIFILRDFSEKRRFLNKMLQLEKSAALGDILSSVANELNNGLTPVMGFPRLLRERCRDDEISEIIAVIDKAAKRCGDIVRSVLKLAQDDQNQVMYSNVNEIIMTTISLEDNQLQSSNIELHLNLNENIPFALASPLDIERLFMHIMGYAEQRMIEYEGGGQLYVESAFDSGNIMVRFKDTGACLLRDEIAEIFDPFSISNGYDRHPRLALSISYHKLREIGGDIYIENEIGKGNTLTVKIPAVKEIHSDGSMPV